MAYDAANDDEREIELRREAEARAERERKEKEERERREKEERDRAETAARAEKERKDAAAKAEKARKEKEELERKETAARAERTRKEEAERVRRENETKAERERKAEQDRLRREAARDSERTVEENRKEAERETEVIKEREAARKREQKRLHDDLIKQKKRDAAFKRDQKKRELEGLRAEAPRLEETIRKTKRGGTKGTNVRAYERQKTVVEELRKDLADATREERSALAAIELHARKEREVGGKVKAKETESRTLKESKETYESLKREHDALVLELAELTRQHRSLTEAERTAERKAANDNSAQERKETEEERELERLRGALATTESDDRRTVASANDIRRKLTNDERRAQTATIKSRPDDGTSRELEMESRRETSEIAGLKSDIAGIQTELRALEERLKEKQRRLESLVGKLEEVKQQMEGAKRHTTKADPQAGRIVEADKTELAKLEQKHIEYQGKVKALEGEIAEHTTLLTSLKRHIVAPIRRGMQTASDIAELITKKERSKDELARKLAMSERDVEIKSRSANDTTVLRALQSEQEEERRAKSAHEANVRKLHELEGKLRDAERMLATYANDNEKAAEEARAEEEHGRSATMRKHEQDLRTKKLETEIAGYDEEIEGYDRELAA